MRLSRILCYAILVSGLALGPAVGRGADILQEVPGDALGFVVIHNLKVVNANAERLTADLQRNEFSPLTFLKSVTGLEDGLNLDGDALLAVYPDAGDDESQLHFGVWLPIADYDRFMQSIGATPNEGISAATVAGEDLLVARRGDWVVVMDPDQRDRLARLIHATPTPPPQLAAWKQWIDGNDVTVVAFAPGIRQLLVWADETGGGTSGKPGEFGTDENPFGMIEIGAGNRQLVAMGAGRAPSSGVAAMVHEFRQWTKASREIERAFQQVSAAGCGLRLEPSGNALASLRMALNDAYADQSATTKDSDLLFDMYDQGGFVVNGGGRLPTSTLVSLASAYVGRIADQFKTEERTVLDETALKQLRQAVERAAADVHSIQVLTQPGAEPQPVCTNSFMELRVASAGTFVSHANEVMRLWNKANRDAQGETRLVFDVEEVKVAERIATQYSLDIADMEGTPALPEIRQAMEKLFGPGGKMRVWIVPVSDDTVLLATATPEQVADMLKTLDRKQPIDWNRGELSECNRLLAAESDWRIFLDAHRYFDWLGRQAIAQTGVPVIGGPLVRPFPASPPIGIAGGFRDHELWIEAATLAPTVKAATAYLSELKARNSSIQRRLQPVPR